MKTLQFFAPLWAAIQFFAALLAAKCARIALRALRRNASYLPGAIALRLCPDFLARAAKPPRVIAVTGTNGKTTVSNLLRDALETLGERVLSNRLGSNVAAGIAASLANGVTVLNRAKYAVAVFEVDERFTPKILPHLKPELLVVTNLFRDSIMRNAHPEFIAGFIERAVPPDTRLILNADDPISSALCRENARVYFGLERMDGDVTDCANLVNDMRVCPVCREELVYDYRRYHHIGRCHCPACGYASPEYGYAGQNVDFAAMSMSFRFPSGETETIPLPSDSVFNVYNLTAVAAALGELGYAPPRAAAALNRVSVVESRYNETAAGDTTVVMQMSKGLNAIATSRACEYVAARPGRKEIILMVSCIADSKHWSENTCWLYDCDFETLADESVTRVVAAGPRAKDFYLRLLLAGVPEERLRCVARETDAPDALAFDGERVFILYAADAIDIAFRVKARAMSLATEKSAEKSAMKAGAK
ncbi:MAG: MurT ligase domain-containing protein [Oscillospiraceae bacterium]|nr:MurT ligase domain-containing protein [Oscillospiraceae bacterium]